MRKQAGGRAKTNEFTLNLIYAPLQASGLIFTQAIQGLNNSQGLHRRANTGGQITGAIVPVAWLRAVTPSTPFP
eukprot:scaffold27622_cov19-Tisochrysis_lutea.AAC.2